MLMKNLATNSSKMKDFRNFFVFSAYACSDISNLFVIKNIKNLYVFSQLHFSYSN